MSVFSAIKLILTLKCEQSNRLISQSFDADLSRCERLAVRLHVLMCRSCRKFKKKLRLLHEMLQQDELSSVIATSMKDITLSTEDKNRIQKSLSSQLQ